MTKLAMILNLNDIIDLFSYFAFFLYIFNIYIYIYKNICLREYKMGVACVKLCR